MQHILFLAHRMPFPPDRGDKIRSHNVLKALARLAPVHVATFADDAADWSCEPQLAQLARSYCLVARRKSVPVAAMQAIVRRRPVSLTAFEDQRIRAYVETTLRAHEIGAIYVFSGQMAQYVPADFRGRVVADLVDVDSAKFEAYGAAGHGPRQWMERREAKLLAAEEQRIVHFADETVLISREEAALLAGRIASPHRPFAVLGNGIDAAAFAPDAVEPDAGMVEAGFPRIIFTGQMDYAPNIAGVERAAREILPRIRQAFPQASFHIVGRNPSREVSALAQIDGVTVWGRVADVRPFLKAADAALVPLAIARGVQNKVLEAMAMALPVVLTSGAATGIAAQDDTHFLVRDEDDAMAQALVTLARDRSAAASLGQRAREWICAHASWEAALAELPRLCGFAMPEPCATHMHGAM